MDTKKRNEILKECHPICVYVKTNGKVVGPSIIQLCLSIGWYVTRFTRCTLYVTTLTLFGTKPDDGRLEPKHVVFFYYSNTYHLIDKHSCIIDGPTTFPLAKRVELSM